MTTTPDTGTLVARLRELVEAADLPNPILLTKAIDYNGDLVATLSDGTGVEARIYVEETADLIEAALNDLPALLDALAAAEEAHDVTTEALAAAERERDSLARRCAVRFEETEKLRAKLAAVSEIFPDLVDDDPCTHDHHGYCQAHGWLAPGECPHARAKRLMAPEASDV